ncbi:YopX family protein [Paenibacillus apiarius]|uniref:YopX family protein n=1 Tax=Paenibacillus apiarius TaxID=46240 RepID=UPI003B3BD7AA
MSRPLKFRAWDAKQKAMFPIHKMEFHKIDNELVHLSGVDIHHKDSDFHGDVYYGGPANKMTGTPPVKRFVIMQYIGLKDRNGKEICEGDICNYGDFIGVVRYGDGCFKITDGQHSAYFISSDCNEIAVIGNIYEHPHLLKGDSKDE